MHAQHQIVLMWSHMFKIICWQGVGNSDFIAGFPFSILFQFFMPCLHFLLLSQLEDDCWTNSWTQAICLQVVRRPGLDLELFYVVFKYVYIMCPTILGRILVRCRLRKDLILVIEQPASSWAFKMEIMKKLAKEWGLSLGLMFFIVSWARQACIHLCLFRRHFIALWSFVVWNTSVIRSSGEAGAPGRR